MRGWYAKSVICCALIHQSMSNPRLGSAMTSLVPSWARANAQTPSGNNARLSWALEVRARIEELHNRMNVLEVDEKQII